MADTYNGTTSTSGWELAVPARPARGASAASKVTIQNTATTVATALETLQADVAPSGADKGIALVMSLSALTDTLPGPTSYDWFGVGAVYVRRMQVANVPWVAVDQ